MKNTYFILFAILLLVQTARSQTDTIIRINETDISSYVYAKVKYGSTGEIKLKQDTLRHLIYFQFLKKIRKLN
jgi:hypothetical protein